MARKKHKKHHRSYRRSKGIGAVGSMITDSLGLVAGVVVAKQLNKFLPSVDTRIMAAGKVVVGALLPKFIKTPIVRNVGNGMIAIGGYELVTGFVPSLGAADDVVVLSGLDEVGGLDQIGADIAEVNGMDIAEVNGYDEY